VHDESTRRKETRTYLLIGGFYFYWGVSAQLQYAVELPTRPIVLVEAKPAEDAESEMRGGQAVVESTPAQIITLRRGSKRPVEIV